MKGVAAIIPASRRRIFLESSPRRCSPAIPARISSFSRSASGQLRIRDKDFICFFPFSSAKTPDYLLRIFPVAAEIGNQDIPGIDVPGGIHDDGAGKTRMGDKEIPCKAALELFVSVLEYPAVP